MARLFGLVLPDEKRVDYALTLVYGVGWSNVRDILKQVKIDPHTRMQDISDEEMKKVAEYIEKNYLIEGELRQEVSQNVRRLRDIHAYRGLRHTYGLPSRGQRTRSNARVRKGKRKTIGALTKEAWAKLEEQQKKSVVKSKK